LLLLDYLVECIAERALVAAQGTEEKFPEAHLIRNRKISAKSFGHDTKYPSIRNDRYTNVYCLPEL
jgi:hypothetical protein